jgi:hypothetical protein
MPASSLALRATTQATTAAPTTSTSTAAAPQLTGNAAAQERLGTATTDAPKPAGSTDAALAAMGPVGAVVLDAMPQSAAILAAWKMGPASWAGDWLADQPPTAVASVLSGAVRSAFDNVFPVGLGFGLGLYGEGSFFAGLALQSSASVERTKGGVFVSAEAVGDATGGAGPGFEVKGAGDDTELAAKAGGKAGARGEGLAEWDLPIEALLQTLGAEQSVNLLLGRTLDRAVLVRAIERLVKMHAPTMLRASVGACWEMGAKGIVGHFVNEAVTTGSATVGGGLTNGEPFFEVRGDAQDVVKHPLLLAFNLDKLAVGTQMTMRVIDGDQPRYEFSIAKTHNETTVEDEFATGDLRAAAAWLKSALLNPAGVDRSGERSMAASALPDVTLTRSVSRTYADVSELPATAMERVESMGIETVDKLGYAAFLDLEADAVVEGTLRVPTEAVRAAMKTASLPVGEEQPEVAVLDAARAIAAKAIGGNTYAYTAADLLDPEKGIAKTELEDLSVVTSMKVEAGFGGDLGIGGVNGGAEAGLSQRTDLSALKPEERRELVA